MCSPVIGCVDDTQSGRTEFVLLLDLCDDRFVISEKHDLRQFHQPMGEHVKSAQISFELSVSDIWYICW